ncbi:alpha/beta hydrolase [Oceanobacillus massiliensis]|uniref:alpha/beta hydrolase n=1 Tax=Oceanobacillus massiliensis TaxID=1465765 RepID=UPI000287D87B|nr:alpha/beta hydrolase [Oceanobacillus massiliensis]
MDNTFWLTTSDDVEIFVKKWYSITKKPKAIIQLAHGMAEHIGRYDTFANYLTEQGFLVFGNDHRGHGRTGERQGIQGYFADENGFHKTAEDLYEVTKHIRQDDSETPIYIIGHSMGSFLVRNYIQAHSDIISGAVLSGTGFYPKAVSLAGKGIASMLPPKQASKLMNHLAFSSNNHKIKERKNGFEWLTRDESILETYMNDPFTGFIPTGRFFYDLLTGILTMQSKKQNKYIRKDLPLLLISGDADPIGNYAKGVWKTANLYKKSGLQNVSVMLYTDGRHELLNEINREEVFESIIKWINHQLL